jgi:hypothetical protein
MSSSLEIVWADTERIELIIKQNKTDNVSFFIDTRFRFYKYLLFEIPN